MKLLRIIAIMIFTYSAYDYGKMIGLADGAKEEREANRNKLESCQRLMVANMFEK